MNIIIMLKHHLKMYFQLQLCTENSYFLISSNILENTGAFPGMIYGVINRLLYV